MTRKDQDALAEYEKSLKLAEAIIAFLPPPDQLVVKMERAKITILELVFNLV